MNLDKKIAKIVKKNHSEKLVDNINELKPIAEAFDPAKPIMVSIICNTYNHEKYIAKCLDGFLMQKVNFNVEILVHDDASNDNTQKIIKEYEEKFPNIIKPIYQKENQYSRGVNCTSMYQYPRAKGKYISFCEGDDAWIDCFKLILTVNFLEANEHYSSCFHKTIYNDLVHERIFVTPKHLLISKNLKFKTAIKGGGGYVQFSSFTIRKKLLLQKPDFLSVKGIGGDFQCYIYATLCGQAKILNSTMSIYNHGHPGSWTLSGLSSDSNNHIKYLDKLILFYETLYKKMDTNFLKPIKQRMEKIIFLKNIFLGDYESAKKDRRNWIKYKINLLWKKVKC